MWAQWRLVCGPEGLRLWAATHRGLLRGLRVGVVVDDNSTTALRQKPFQVSAFWRRYCLYRQILAREIPVFLRLFVLKRTVAMGFPAQGVSRSKEGYQRWYRASLGRCLLGEIFVKTVMYRCHNLLKDVLFLCDERGFLTALPFA